MSWRAQLRAASFRGAGFRVTAHSSEQAGRRVQVHEYPGRDRVWSEDMGLKTREFSVRAYVLGASYMTARDALIDACAKAGSGLLIHPWLGRVMVICTGCRVSESVDEGGLARLELSFVDAGENRFPHVRNDTAQTVDLRATEALSATREAFTAVFRVAGLPDFVSGDAVRIIKTLLTVIKEAGGGLSAIDLDDFTSNIDTSIRKPGPFASRLSDLITSVGRVKPGQSAARPLNRLARFGDHLTEPPKTTATRRRQGANHRALTGLVRRSAMIGMARRAPKMNFDSTGAAFDLRDHLGDLLDQEMEQAIDGEDDLILSPFGRLRTAVMTDLNARARTLADPVEVTPRTTEPSLVTAYRLYGDDPDWVAQSDRLVALNHLPHPGFVPGGQPLKVLNRSGAVNV